jgi:hypothetical protein
MASREQQQAARREKAEAFRQAQRRQERRRRLLWTGIPIAAVLVAAAVVMPTAIHFAGQRDDASADGTGATASQIIPAGPAGGATVHEDAVERVANTTGVQGVLAFDTQGWPGDGTAHAGALQHDHVTNPVQYSVTPPVGGPHDGIWMNAGVYTKPIPSDRAVHNLEHGAVWITYRPSVSAATVKRLQTFVGKQSTIAEPSVATGQSNRYVDLSPWLSDALPAPIVISSWGYQLRVTSASDPRLQQFVDTFRHAQKYTPEYGAPVDGVPVQTGGRAAMYGAAKPNPAGTQTG